METAAKVNIKQPIDIQKVSIQRDPFHHSAYIITLPLDSEPSYTWQTLFDAEMAASLDFWDRKVLVVGGELKLVTTQEELEEKLKWLEHVVRATNTRVEDFNKKAEVGLVAPKISQKDEEAIRSELSRWMVRRTRP